MPVPSRCPECDGKLEPHCKDVACGWWRCGCGLFGDTKGRSARVPK